MMNDTVFRPYTPADAQPLFLVFLESVNDLLVRDGLEPMADTKNPDDVATKWANNRSVFEHMIATSDSYWVAERAGILVGYAHAFVRDGVRQLTQFFVSPDAQNSGVGRELLTRAFPPNGVDNRIIIATSDQRALVRYLKSGVYPRFPLCYFLQPEPQIPTLETDLVIEPIDDMPETTAALNYIDRIVIGYQRPVDHEFFLQDNDRKGYTFKRNDQIVGYGYVGGYNGPFAVLDSNDFPAVLAFGEAQAAQNHREFDIPVPLINQAAVDYLLSRGARMEFEFTCYFMSAKPLGSYERYIFTSPTFFT
jgi:GNAT superfamily N-acetyltransferase